MKIIGICFVSAFSIKSATGQTVHHVHQDDFGRRLLDRREELVVLGGLFPFRVIDVVGTIVPSRFISTLLSKLLMKASVES
jgi:hypothetical protein